MVSSTTAINRVVEIASLGRVGSSEAAVIVSTEAIWAAVFAAILINEKLGVQDYIGGSLIILACLVSTET